MYQSLPLIFPPSSEFRKGRILVHCLFWLPPCKRFLIRNTFSSFSPLTHSSSTRVVLISPHSQHHLQPLFPPSCVFTQPSHTASKTQTLEQCKINSLIYAGLQISSEYWFQGEKYPLHFTRKLQEQQTYTDGQQCNKQKVGIVKGTPVADKLFLLQFYVWIAYTYFFFILS